MSFFRKLKMKIKKVLTKSPKIHPVMINVQSDTILNGRCAIITGGSSGLGFSIAEAYLRAGATIIITGRNIEKLSSAESKLKSKANGRVFSFIMDNNNIHSFHDSLLEMEKMVEKKIDILVNNAGVSCKTSFLNITEEDFDNTISIDLKAMVFLSQEFAHYMIENNICGNILNIGSSSGLRPANTPYTIAKWGVRGFTLGIAKQLIKYNIVVNGIAPGPTATPMLTQEQDNLSGPKNDAKRFAHPEEIASMAVQLVSNSCRMIIGDMVNINGGSGTLTFDDVNY